MESIIIKTIKVLVDTFSILEGLPRNEVVSAINRDDMKKYIKYIEQSADELYYHIKEK